MEGSIFFGLITLFKEYVIILENALIYGMDITEKGGSRINIAASLQQQISILANLSALEQLFLRMVRGINGGNDHINAHAISCQQHELASFTLSMHEASSRLTVCFCQHYIRRIMSVESSCELAQIICNHAHGDPCVSHDPMPSITFQVFPHAFLFHFSLFPSVSSSIAPPLHHVDGGHTETSCTSPSTLNLN